MTIVIIIGVILLIIFLFNNDKKNQQIKVLQRGGLKLIYPNFIQYIELANSGSYLHDLSLSETKFELVKNDGQYLEYRFPIYSFNGDFGGYYHIGIRHTFGAYAYCYCINSYGKKIEGFMSELHNGRNNGVPKDKTIDNYRLLFSSLIMKMEGINNFDEKFYYNNFQ